MLCSETLLKKGRREEKGEDGTSRNKNPKSPLHTQAREQVFGKKDTGPQPRTEQLAVRGRGVGVGGEGLASHLFLLLQLTGLSLQALQLLLRLLEFSRGALQLAGQLLVSESQLGVLSLGFMFVIVESCALAFQLQRGDREEG